MSRLRIGLTLDKKYEDPREKGSRSITYATSHSKRGQYTGVEVWCNGFRFKVALDRYLNIISIHRFILSPKAMFPHAFWDWRQEFNRGYKRKKPFSPFYMDIICCAVEYARSKRHARNS